MDASHKEHFHKVSRRYSCTDFDQHFIKKCLQRKGNYWLHRIDQFHGTSALRVFRRVFCEKVFLIQCIRRRASERENVTNDRSGTVRKWLFIYLYENPRHLSSTILLYATTSQPTLYKKWVSCHRWRLLTFHRIGNYPKLWIWMVIYISNPLISIN